MMKGVNNNSQRLLEFIEPNTVGAELGVWKGDTSYKFLKRNVKELHLVDSWSLQAYEYDDNILSKVINRYSRLVGSTEKDDYEKYYNKVYLKVKKRFAIYPEVKIHRMVTSEWFNLVQDKEFDWIYVDADHHEDGCYRDLVNSYNIIKDGGLLLGDDYGNKLGVKTAVDKFVKEYNIENIEFFAILYILVRSTG